MELSSEVLWKACSWVLLGFLVERLIFLLVCLSENGNSVSGVIKEGNNYKNNQSSIVDDDDEFDEQQNGVLSKKVEFQEVDFYGEMNSTKKDDDMIYGSDFIQDLIRGFDEYNEEIEGNFKVMNNIEDGEFGEDLVDKIEKEGKKIVGFEEKFSGKFESGKINDDDYGKDEILRLNDGECHGIEVNLGREVIEESGRKGENSSNGDDRGEISGREMAIEKDEGVLSDDEEWEGIERSELEKRFAEAMNKEGNLVKRGNDVNMQLYGLQKVAMEGPCYESQPMALKLNARAKWNAWQRLGNMTREDAMEQYINLLSDNTFEGMEVDHSSVANQSSSSETAVDSYPGAN